MPSISQNEQLRLIHTAIEGVNSAQATFMALVEAEHQPAAAKLRIALLKHVGQCTEALQGGFGSRPLAQEPEDVASLAQMLRRFAQSFDAVLIEAQRETGIRGYDNIVSETLGDGLVTELEMLAKGLAEQEREAALARKLPQSNVTRLLAEARSENFAMKPPAPSKSRAPAASASAAGAKAGKA